MDFDSYHKAFYVQPAPEPRFRFSGSFGTTLYVEDFRDAVVFYDTVLGPPAYVEGEDTRGWPIGNGCARLPGGGSIRTRDHDRRSTSG
jgi:hypothetical protein